MTYRKTLLLVSACLVMVALLPASADQAAEQELRVVVEQAALAAEEAADAVAEATDAPEAAEAPQDQENADTAEAEDKKKQPSKEELREKMQQLEQELAQKRNEYQQKAREDREKQKEEARDTVKDITLPDNPTREQSEAFVEKLRDAAEHVTSYSSSDPIVDKLKQLPGEHYDLLIGEIHNRTKLRYFANYAMRDIDVEVLRERFVESVDSTEHGIAVIVMHGWVQDVRDAVIKRMETADGTLSPAWFQAAVELDDPALYPKLHEVTINSRYATQFLSMLQTLPDYDMGHTVDVCWKRHRENKLSISSSTISTLAAEHGNAEALGYLVNQLRYSTSYMSSATSHNSRRLKVLRHIDYRGSNTEIMEWYEANKDKLVFDHYRKRFMLPDADTQGFDPPPGSDATQQAGDAADGETESEPKQVPPAEEAAEEAVDEAVEVEVQIRRRAR